MTKSYPKRYNILLIVASVLFAITFGYEHYYISKLNNRNEILSSVQESVHTKTAIINNYLNNLYTKLNTLNKNDSAVFKRLSSEFKAPIKDFTFFIYKDNVPVYWSDNSIELSAGDKQQVGDEQVAYWGSSYYEFYRRTVGVYKITGLLLIKRSEPNFENKFIKNEFNADFKLSDNVLFVNDKSATQKFPVYNSKNKVLFSLFFDGETIKPVPFIIPLLFFIALLIFMTWLYTVVLFFLRVDIVYSFLIVLGMLVGFYLLFVVFKLPRSIYELTLFSPLLYASGKLLGSLGQLVLLTLLLTFFVLVVYRFINDLRLKPNIRDKFPRIYLLPLFIFLVINFYAVLINYLISGLVLNSKITFDLNNLLELTHYSFIGLSVIFSLLFTYFLICESSLRFMLKTKLQYLPVLIAFTIAQVLFISTDYLLKEVFAFAAFSMTNYLQSIIVLILTGLIVINSQKRFTIYNSLLLITIYAAFTSKTLNDLNLYLEREQRKTFADKLQNQQDLLAEYLFDDMSKKIVDDRVLLSYFKVASPLTYSNNDAQTAINDRLQQNYFKGYWSGYNIEAVVFNFNGLPISNPDDLYLKLALFENKIKNDCDPTEVENLFTYKNSNGGTAYIAAITIKDVDNENIPVGTIILELNSKVSKNESGYPELLISQKQANQLDRKSYSYAFYKNNVMVGKGGNFPFMVSDEQYKKRVAGVGDIFDEFSDISYLYRVRSNGDMIVVSKQLSKLKNFFTLFSYTFAFFFTFFAFAFISYKFVTNHYQLNFDFKSRIQLTVTSLIISMMLSIGFITTYNLIRNFNTSQNQKLVEKINAVLLVIENETRNKEFTKEQIEDIWQYKFSEISSSLNCDFNIYDTLGFLLYSTQPKVFELNILGQNMNRIAINELKENPKLNFVQDEQIGTLEYIAAYEPIRNSSSKTIAYLNLPYFKNQVDLRNEVSSLLVVLVNIYVPIFFLSILITLYFSRRLARPLQLIQTSLSKVRLNKANPLIEWKKNDEIGSLVNEYNRMVMELQASAENLAQSEREMAWREMARQVAHEIKNPLTPMKLSVQLLQRALNDGNPDIEKMIKRFSENLVEQIDTLSNIATEFGNFAKMPNANNAVINLQRILKNSAELYNAEDETRIVFQESPKMLYVYADKEQLLRVFSNLLKNALQAIANPANGLVAITVNETDNAYIIAISDNGCGIPDKEREKIFKPNFTTKSTGTGLGLAMAKQIIENANGKLWFESRINIGTTFYVSIPKYVNP